MKKTEWKHAHTITGPPAENEKYLRRQYINDTFWREIGKGCHILFTAPRRVGKTSIMIDLSKNAPSGYNCIFRNIQGCNNQNSFFKALFEILVEQLQCVKKSQRILRNWFKKYHVNEISLVNLSIKIDEKGLLLDLIKELPKIESTCVVFLDEFPDVLSSIRDNEGNETAIDTLNTLREIRQNSEFKNYIMVLAGSIGLEHVVKELDRIKLINDLKPIHVSPLNEGEAIKLIRQLIKNATMQIGNESITYLLKKISHPIPYYIQLIIEECDKILFERNTPELSIEVIDQAFDKVIKDDSNFHDWDARLKISLKEKYTFAKDILTDCAHNTTISAAKIYNFAKKRKQEDGYMDIIRMLEKDGYIIAEDQNFSFLSPLLRQWWKQQHPAYELEDK